MVDAEIPAPPTSIAFLQSSSEEKNEIPVKAF